MAEEQAATRTEEPSAKKLADAKAKGDFAKTPDLPALASLTAVAAVLAMAGGGLARNMAVQLRPFLASPDALSLRGDAGAAILHQAMMAAAPLMAAIMAAACAAGVAGNLVQSGWIFTTKKLMPDFSRLSPARGVKRLVSIDSLMQSLKSIVKVAMTAGVAWWVLRPHWDQLRGLAALDPGLMLPFVADILRRVVFAVAALLLLIAGADWFWQRSRFMKRMKMTKEEVKEEFKQADGDPLIKGKLRQMRHDRARRRMMQAVPTATVVVMNPTHYAVALKYDQGENPAPLCVAKGLDTLALKIREVAEAAGVPIIEDPPLARALYASVEIDDIIPPAHYEAVAKVIGFIMNAGQRIVGRVR
jgi:flagellar biosynthetic protein FlhB